MGNASYRRIKPLFSHKHSSEDLGRKPIQSHNTPKGAGQPVTERTIQGTPTQSLAKTRNHHKYEQEAGFRSLLLVASSRS